MKRIYIMEGPDGCGKSVLATDLLRELEAPAVLTRHGPYPGDKEVWRRYLTSMLPALTGLADCVLDRSWLSESIYGAVYRGGADRISVWQRRMLERVALSRGAALTFCRTDWETCAENFRLRKAEGGEMLDDVTQLKEVYHAYRDLEVRALFPQRMFTEHVACYDYRRGKLDTLLERHEADYLANDGPGLGRWAPGKVALLIGERPGRGSDGGRWHLPFVSFRADGCSAWLAEELEKSGVPEASLYWVNAYDGPDGTQLNVNFISRLRPCGVFALGKEAAEWCELYGVSCRAFTHPQYHKRFQAKKPYPLMKELRACLKITTR